MKKTLVFIAFILLSAESLFSQNYQFTRDINPIPVMAYGGVEYEYPFLGGLNHPRPQFLDIDADGDMDLFLQESHDQIMYFENVGTSSEYQFTWHTDEYKNISIGNWFKFVDIDGDGDFDLLSEQPSNRIKIHRNTGSAQSPEFELAVDTLRAINGEEIFPGSGTIPTFADIDCDDDPDLFYGNQDGTITLYTNTGLDDNNLPLFQFTTDRFQDIEIVSGNLRRPKTPQHGANAFTFEDIDSDGDFDLFWGDFFLSSLYYLPNDGTCTTPDISVENEEYPSLNPLSTGGYNLPAFADLNGDNLQEMHIGVLGGSFSTAADLSDNFYRFSNAGSSDNPFFLRETKRFLSGIDIGDKSTLTFGDLDGDGDPDLIMANEKDPADNSSSRLYFFRNTGSASSFAFTLADTNYLDLDYSYNYASTLVDINADTTLDLFIGDFQGKIRWYRNDGTPSEPNFILESEAFQDIDVGNHSKPVFQDLDADGDYDLVVGEFGGNLNYYENTGTASAPNFVFVTENYMSIDVGNHSAPACGDMNDDGLPDLIVGSESQGITIYTNVGTAGAPDFESNPPFQLEEIGRAAPSLLDENNDGLQDIFSGTLEGGLRYYRNDTAPTKIDDEQTYTNVASGIKLLGNYPNPFNGETVIRFTVPNETSPHSLNIYDITGRLVFRDIIETGSPEISYRWDARNLKGKTLSSGLYWYRISGANLRSDIGQLLLIR